MQIKKSILKAVGIVVIVLTLVILAKTVFSDVNKSNNTSEGNTVVNTDGKQIIQLTAKGGYSPSVIEAKANQDIVLRVSTSNTFDCSSAILIPKLGIRKNLPVTGKTDIAITAQSAGTIIDGTCSMGMYFFKIKFI